uniref:Uncharacterized protein n=1 Tax=Trypanosoma vivax (strain Y486) TaxID=1055687 RepID=G0U8Z5_TRYVY|nr:hypothetical protein TVY486_1115610 [Trypanosoma vivax Y486]
MSFATYLLKFHLTRKRIAKREKKRIYFILFFLKKGTESQELLVSSFSSVGSIYLNTFVIELNFTESGVAEGDDEVAKAKYHRIDKMLALLCDRLVPPQIGCSLFMFFILLLYRARAL